MFKASYEVEKKLLKTSFLMNREKSKFFPNFKYVRICFKMCSNKLWILPSIFFLKIPIFMIIRIV